MIATALAVMASTPKESEPEGVRLERHRRRTRYACEVLRAPDNAAQAFIKAMVTLSGATLTPTDAAILAGVGLLWDAFSEELMANLRKGTPTRAAYDTAWLAHAIVDGLTPAHHFPYEEKLIEIRGESIDTRTSIKDKLLMPGETVLDSLKNNWKMWGPDGLMSMHGLFEMGIAVMITPLKFRKAIPTEANLKKVNEIGIEEWFARSARQIAMLDMYDRFCSRGWTLKLAREVRNELAPTIIKTVTLAWYSAMRDAGLLRTKK
jgi:hypothetical protein